MRKAGKRILEEKKKGRKRNAGETVKE